MFSMYPEGSDLTILKCNYTFPRKIENTNKYTNGSITIVAKDNVSNKKIMKTINNPGYTYYTIKKSVMEDRRINHNLEYIEKDCVEPVTCAYKDLLKSIAEKTNNLEFYNANIQNGNRRENEKLHLCTGIMFSDMNIEDYYRFLFSKKFQNRVVPVSKAFFDIEVDTINMAGDFPEPGECPINAITIVDWQNYTVYTLLLRNQNNPLIEQFENEDRDKQIEELKSIMQDTVGGEAQFKKNGLNNLDFKLLFFDEEIQLIYGLFDIINIKKPDFVLAWNMAFDIPYIIARIKNLGYDPTDIMCNPDFEDKQCKYVVDDKDMKGETKVFAERGDYAVISSYSEFIDQMIQFASRRKGQSAFVSFKLDDIGEKVAKVHKLNYSAITTNLSKLPYLNYKIFVFYNIIDTIVQICIENETGDIDFLFNRALTSNTRYRKSYRQTVYLINRIISEYYDMGYVIGNNKNKFNEKPKDKFPGAFVADPTKISDKPKLKINGHPVPILNNLDDYDFARLYPSITQEFNISNETLLGKLIIAQKIYQFENKSRDSKFSREGAFIEDLSSNNHLEFCHRWFGLANYSELLDDIVEYIAIYKPYYDSIARMSNNGLIIPYLKDERISSTLIKPYEISNEQENIKPYYISKERDKDIDRRLIDAYNSNRGYPFK